MNLYAIVLMDNDLIVVHPSKYYHSNSKTIEYTNKLISNSTRSILTFQNDPSSDPLWYVTRRSKNSYYSRAGELDVSFDTSNSKIELNFAGGYLTSCLGRTVSEVIGAFLVYKDLKELVINLKSKAIFTGHQVIENQLEPKTAYEESILDDTIDGVNLNRVLRFVNYMDYTKEFISIGFINKSPVSNLNLDSKLAYLNREILLNIGSKIIRINIE